MTVSRDSLRRLRAKAEELNIQVNDFLSQQNMADGFVYGMIHQYGVENNAESVIQFCIDNNIKDLNSLLNFVAKDLFKT